MSFTGFYRASFSILYEKHEARRDHHIRRRVKLRHLVENRINKSPMFNNPCNVGYNVL